jgi:succinyl-CoA synthetase beta subunit
MRFLLENEAKQVLASAGIEVPESWSDGFVPEDVSGPFYVKVLVPNGRRGKRGGVVRVDRRDEIDEATRRVLSGWNGVTPAGVHIERAVDGLSAEVYLGVVADRDRAVPLLLVGLGGVDVEDVGVEQIPMSPVEPWQPYIERRLVEVLAALLPGVDPSEIVEDAHRLVDVYYEQGAYLLEVNPLGVRADGSTVALDAKLIRSGPPTTTSPTAPDIEEVARRFGINVVDGGGDLAVITSGAGLLMATVDLLGDRGAHFGPLIDLGGTVFGDAGRVPEILQAVRRRRPRRIFVSYFLQFASCKVLANRIVEGLGDGGEIDVIVRQRGVDSQEAAEILVAAGFRVVEGLEEACILAVPPVTVDW